MPFDLIADWKARPEATPEDKLWGKVAYAFATKLRERHPTLRFRLRNFGIKVDKLTSVTEAEMPVKSLFDRLEAPPNKYFWVRAFDCEECKAVVSHNRRLIHLRKGHTLKPKDITHKGIKRTWTPGFKVLVGQATSFAGYGGHGFVLGITGTPIEPKAMMGFDVAFLLQLRKGDYAAATKDLAGKAAQVVVLPASFDEAVDEFVKVYSSFDKEAFDEVLTVEEEEDQEYKEQLEATNAAGSYIVGALKDPRLVAKAAKQMAAVGLGSDTKRQILPQE